MWGRTQTLGTSSAYDHMKKYLLMNKLSGDHHHHHNRVRAVKGGLVCGGHIINFLALLTSKTKDRCFG